jgi:hypothetical protein
VASRPVEIKERVDGGARFGVACLSGDSSPNGGAMLRTVTLFASEGSVIMSFVASEQPLSATGN